MKTIIVDDEPMALEVLENMLGSYKDINIIGSYTRPIDAIKSLEDEKPDIIFLDIEMGELNGLELAEVFMKRLDKVEIVFVTAYSQYAVEAFEINAIDYLLKPIQENRLLKAVERLRQSFKENQIKEELEISNDYLQIYSFGGFQVLDKLGNPLTWRTQKSKELFAYLWMKKERPVSKSTIMEDIFPDRDPDKASTILHTTIYQLRKNLEKLGYGNGIIFADESYQLNLPIRSDLEELGDNVAYNKCSEENIIKVLELYKGDFLEEGYHWGIDLQESYRTLVLKTLERFSKIQIDNNILCLLLKMSLDKAYSIDPYNSSIAEMMIHYYGSQSEIPSLVDFFNEYSNRLKDEVDLKPRQSTINVYKKYMG